MFKHCRSLQFRLWNFNGSTNRNIAAGFQFKCSNIAEVGNLCYGISMAQVDTPTLVTVIKHLIKQKLFFYSQTKTLAETVLYLKKHLRIASDEEHIEYEDTPV